MSDNNEWSHGYEQEKPGKEVVEILLDCIADSVVEELRKAHVPLTHHFDFRQPELVSQTFSRAKADMTDPDIKRLFNFAVSVQKLHPQSRVYLIPDEDATVAPLTIRNGKVAEVQPENDAWWVCALNATRSKTVAQYLFDYQINVPSITPEFESLWKEITPRLLRPKIALSAKDVSGLPKAGELTSSIDLLQK